MFYLCAAVTWPSRDPAARMKVSRGGVSVCDGTCQAFWGFADKLQIRAERRLRKMARLKDYCLSNRLAVVALKLQDHFFFCLERQKKHHVALKTLKVYILKSLPLCFLTLACWWTCGHFQKGCWIITFWEISYFVTSERPLLARCWLLSIIENVVFWHF